MSNELNTVKKKIAKLMALGQNNASLSEANVALTKASSLMEEWGLTLDDIQLGQEDITYKVIDTGGKQRPVTNFMLVNLAEFLGVKVWVSSANRYDRNSTFRINVLGYETDVEMFEFFNKVLEATFEGEWDRYKETAEYANANRMYHGKSIRTSFLRGFCNEVNEKLETLIEEGQSFKTKSGTALVPLKMGKIEEHFAEEFGIRLRKRSGSTQSRTNSGYGAGKAAGGRVSFNKPVNGGGGMKMIG